MKYQSAVFLVLVLEYTAISYCEECKHTTYEPRGTFQTPNYPDEYPPNTECMFRIFTNNFVDVAFESFAIHETRNCGRDVLQVLFEATAKDARPSRYCGDGLAKIEGGHLRGKGPLIMMFGSDDKNALGGFKFSYEFEITGPHTCDSNPCQNGGTCIKMVGYYKCDCAEGYHGKSCEVDWSDCASQPCQHGGQCEDSGNGYTCECINGFTGESCETEPNPCQSSPCQNGGLCENKIPDFICSCPRSFMGAVCEDEVPTLPPPTTTPPPTTITTTTTSEPTEDQSHADLTDDQDKDADGSQRTINGKDTGGKGGIGAEGNKDNEESGREITSKWLMEHGKDFDLDEITGDDGSSGITAAAVIICVLVATIAILFTWHWFKSHRKSTPDVSRDGDETQKGEAHRNSQSSSYDFIKKSKQHPEDQVTEEVESQKNGRKKRRRRNKTAIEKSDCDRLSDRYYKLKMRKLSNDDEQVLCEQDINLQDVQKKTPRKIDLSPEEAAAVLKQLLGRQDHHKNTDHSDANQIIKDVMRKQALWDNQSESKQSSSPVNHQITVRKPTKTERKKSPTLQVMEISTVHNEKTLDLNEKVLDWLESAATPDMQGKRDRSRATPSPTLAVESRTPPDSNGSTTDDKEVSIDNEELGVIAPSRTQSPPKFQQNRIKNMLPITRNKAKSLVDKLVRAPVKSNQNVVGPRLGVKREKAFME